MWSVKVPLLSIRLTPPEKNIVSDRKMPAMKFLHLFSLIILNNNQYITTQALKQP